MSSLSPASKEDYRTGCFIVQSNRASSMPCLRSRVVQEQPSSRSVSLRVQPEASGQTGRKGPGRGMSGQAHIPVERIGEG